MIDLEKACREELIHLNSQLLSQLQVLNECVKQLETELPSLRGSIGIRRLPGLDFYQRRENVKDAAGLTVL